MGVQAVHRAAAREHALAIEEQVPRDARQPGREGPRGIEARQRAPGAHEGLLREVLGLGVRAGLAQQEGVHGGVVEQDQLIEGRQIP